MQKSYNNIFNINTRFVKTDLIDLDLDEIYDKIVPVFGGIELVSINGKNKQSNQLSEKNKRNIDKKSKRKGKYKTTFFANCIGIAFPEWHLKLFKNGSMNAICFPDEETFEKGIKVLFDIIKDMGYDPYIVSQKDILKKNSSIIIPSNENRIEIYL
ncbi:MAG: hypothetical protein MUO21_12155 [Nitrososphaeraceae archaeon]|nr:hypothetical protein [Nitrososphaeraceae archaeon]